jgi:hypothetical protein
MRFAEEYIYIHYISTLFLTCLPALSLSDLTFVCNPILFACAADVRLLSFDKLVCTRQLLVVIHSG